MLRYWLGVVCVFCYVKMNRKIQMNICEKHLSLTEYESNLLLSLVDREIRESYSYLKRNTGYPPPHDVLRREEDLKATETLMSKLEQLTGITA